MTALRIGDEFDLDVGGTMIRGVIKSLFGFNNRSERLWLVEIDGVDPGWPVPERAMIRCGGLRHPSRRIIEMEDD